MRRPADSKPSSAIDPVAADLRVRRRWHAVIAIALLTLTATAVLSHVRAGPDSNDWDGRSVIIDQVLSDGTLLVARRDAEPLKIGLRAVDLNGSEPAVRYLTGRLTGKPVVLKFDDPTHPDTAGRQPAYLYLGDSDCVNIDLVRDGIAYFDRRSKSFLTSTLDQAETNARTRKIGLWKDLRFRDMPPWRQDWVNAMKTKR